MIFWQQRKTLCSYRRNHSFVVGWLFFFRASSNTFRCGNVLRLLLERATQRSRKTSFREGEKKNFKTNSDKKIIIELYSPKLLPFKKEKNNSSQPCDEEVAQKPEGTPFGKNIPRKYRLRTHNAKRDAIALCLNIGLWSEGKKKPEQS